MIEQDIKLLEHCVLDLQHRVQALEAQVKKLQRRVITLAVQAEHKDEPQTDVYDYKGNGKWERSE